MWTVPVNQYQDMQSRISPQLSVGPVWIFDRRILPFALITHNVCDLKKKDGNDSQKKPEETRRSHWDLESIRLLCWCSRWVIPHVLAGHTKPWLWLFSWTSLLIRQKNWPEVVSAGRQQGVVMKWLITDNIGMWDDAGATRSPWGCCVCVDYSQALITRVWATDPFDEILLFVYYIFTCPFAHTHMHDIYTHVYFCS